MGTPLIGLVRSGGEPFLYFGTHDPFPNAFSVVNLRAGTLWIRSQQLANSSPAGSFVGFQITGGQITLGTFILGNPGQTIEVGASTVQATLKLAQDTTPGSGAPLAVVQMPDTAVFKCTSTSSSLLSTTNSSFTTLGSTVHLSYASPPPAASWDTALSRINFPLKADVTALTIASSSTRLVALSGTNISIQQAVWSLPVKTGTAADLGDVVGEGGLALYLDTGLITVPQPYGDASIQIDCGASVLIVQQVNTLAIRSVNPKIRQQRYSIHLSSSGSIVFEKKSTVRGLAFSSRDGNETWAFFSQMIASFDQPRTVNNERIKVGGTGAIELLQRAIEDPIGAIIEARSDSKQNPASGKATQAYALKNLLLKGESPSLFVVRGNIAEGYISEGTLTLTSALTYVLPFLPDPYTTNCASNIGVALKGERLGQFDLISTWKPETPIVLDIKLPPAALDGISLLPPTAGRSKNTVDDLELLRSMSDSFGREVGGNISGPLLLDLSSRVSQFGIQFPAGQVFYDVAASTVSPTVSNLFLQTPANRQRVFALPPVEWEPVFMAQNADPADPIPNPYTFPDSGFPTFLATNAVTLRPVAPQEALDGLIASFRANPPKEVVAEFTLPFGIVSFAKLSRPRFNRPFVWPASISNVKPTFQTSKLVGGNQVSMRAATTGLAFQTRPPSFPGAAIMLKYTPPAATSQTPVTVLGYKARDFSSDFGPNAPTGPGFHGPLVPATRVDISGYGESVFSEWNDPDVLAPGTSKVDLEVLVGRTEREVVQQVYEVVHIGARFIRTITMKRLDTGRVVRSSVLKPVTDGLYRFQNLKIVTHPGLVRGYHNIRNVRDLPGDPIIISGTKFVPVKYDCDVHIESNGPGTILVPALDHKGYMIVDQDNNNPFGPIQYSQLLLNFKANIGGPIDCTVKISNLTIKLTSIGVDRSTPDTGGDPQFAICAKGMVEFAGHGEWSFLRMVPSRTPDYVDNTGVPVIRVGPSTTGSAVTDPYRFADPGDLLSQFSTNNYCLLHTTPSQRVLFPRPKIENDGKNQITSIVAPLIADPYTLGFSSGPFPKPNLCIPFEVDPTTKLPLFFLAINANGFFKLSLQNNPFKPPIAKRALVDGATQGIIVYTDGSGGTGDCQVSLTIDSADNVNPWTFSLANVGIASESGESGSRQEFTRTTGSFDCKPSAPPTLKDPVVKLGPPLDPVAKVVAFLQAFGAVPPFDVSMTNDWSLYVGLKMDLERYLEYLAKKAQFDIGKFIREYIQNLDFGYESNTRALALTTTTTFRVIIKFPTPWPAIKIMADAFFKLVMATKWGDGAVSTGTPTLEFGLGAGLGVVFPLGIFKAIGFFLVTQSAIWHQGTSNWGLGTDFLARVSIKLPKEEFAVVKIDVTIETKVEMLFVSCKRPKLTGTDQKQTIWGVAQFIVALDVDIFLIFDFSAEVKGEWTTKFNDGPCDITEF